MTKFKFLAMFVVGAYILGAQAQSTCGSRPIAFGEADKSSGRLTTIQVSLAPMFYARGELYMAYDAEDRGASFSSWAVREKIKDVTEEDTVVVCPVSESWGQSGYRAMRAFLVSSELKDGDYAARLEWIENADKARSYVNTKMIPNKKSHVESRFRRTTDDGQIILYGAGGQTITGWMGKNTGLKWRFGTAEQLPEATKKNLWYDFVQDANGVQFVCEDGTTKAPTKYSNIGSLGTSTIQLFRNGTDSSYSYPIQMGYWRYSEDGEVLADFIPCQLNDGSTGIWDLVSKSALTLSGTFNAGPAMTFASELTDVTPEAYLFTTVDTPEIQYLSVSGDAGSSLMVAGRIVVASGDVKNATFRLVYSTSPQFVPVIESDGTASDEDGNFAFEVSGVVPATKYYCRLNVKGESGGVAQSDVIEVTTKGASTMNWSEVTETVDQRVVTYSGKLVEQGVRPTYILLKRSNGEIVGQSVCDDAGNWSITIDLAPYTAWTSSGVSFPHGFICSNDCPGAVFVSESASNLRTKVVDASRYTWTGQGETDNWSDVGNWTSDRQDCVGFPSSLGGHAAFPDETVAEIVVDQDVNCTSIAQGARKVKLRFVAEESHAFGALKNFVNDSNDATSYGSEYVFSGPVTLTGFITTGMDNLVRAENGAQVNGKSDVSVNLALQNNEATPYRGRLELLSGSKFTKLSGEVVINGEAEIVVDDSTFDVNNLVFNCWATGGRIRLRGSTPLVRIRDTLRSQTGRMVGDGGFVFELSREGYEKALIVFEGTPRGGAAANDGSFGKNAPIHWTVDPKSPLFGRSGTRLLSLAEVSYAFSLDCHVFDPLSCYRKAKFITDLESDPKTISFEYTKIGFAVIVVENGEEDVRYFEKLNEALTTAQEAMRIGAAATIKVLENTDEKIDDKAVDASKEVVFVKDEDEKVVPLVQTSTEIMKEVSAGGRALTANTPKLREFLTENKVEEYTALPATAAAISEALAEVPTVEGNNGLALWKDYALGITPTTSVKAAADASKDTDPDAITISIPTIDPAKASGDFTIKYQVVDRAKRQETLTAAEPDKIKIPLATGIYDVKIVFEPAT